jgi:hypothetical protein
MIKKDDDGTSSAEGGKQRNISKASSRRRGDNSDSNRVESIEERRRKNEIHRKKREHTLKNYQIMIEYKHLKQHVPPGIYILPSFDNMRTWCGVIFLRAGLWKSGIFRFTIDMPVTYPGNNACPKITFLNQIFHPMIDWDSGEIDLSLRFPNWIGGKHYIVSKQNVKK